MLQIPQRQYDALIIVRTAPDEDVGTVQYSHRPEWHGCSLSPFHLPKPASHP